MNAPKFDQAKRSVVRVGEGRGFIVEGERDRYVITASHCLPFIPRCDSASDIHENTYRELIGAMENEKNNIWAECLFVDPIADIAVLGAPDDQALGEQWKAYSEFACSRPAMRVGEAKPETKAWLLSLDGNWQSCSAGHNGGSFWISDALEGIVGGMSGSPIILDGGAAVGIINCSEESRSTQAFPNARLAINLPGWLLQELNR